MAGQNKTGRLDMATKKTRGRSSLIPSSRKRLAAIRKLDRIGILFSNDRKRIAVPLWKMVEYLNDADSLAPPIQSERTVARWVDRGMPGL